MLTNEKEGKIWVIKNQSVFFFAPVIFCLPLMPSCSFIQLKFEYCQSDHMIVVVAFTKKIKK